MSRIIKIETSVISKNWPFPSSPGLCIITRLSAQPLMRKWFFIRMKKNPFSQERLYTWPHFESEGFRDSQVAYCLQSSNYFKLTPPQDPCLQVVHCRTWHSFRSAGFGVCAQWFSSTTFCCLPLTSTHSTSRYWVPGFSPHDTEH